MNAFGLILGALSNARLVHRLPSRTILLVGSLVRLLLGLTYNRSTDPMAAAVALSAALTGLSYFGLLARGRTVPGR